MSEETDTEHVGHAVIIDGPVWWGDRYAGEDARPVNPKDKTALEQRQEQAAKETYGMTLMLEALPDDCVVFHTGSRGAAQRAATWATVHGHLVVAVPVPPGSDSATEERRNSLAAATVSGLRAHGWKIKALIAYPNRAYRDPVLGSLPHLVEELRRMEVHVKLVHPEAIPPEPEDEPAGP